MIYRITLDVEHIAGTPVGNQQRMIADVSTALARHDIVVQRATIRRHHLVRPTLHEEAALVVEPKQPLKTLYTRIWESMGKFFPGADKNT